jgi:hypothetical protein
VSGGGKGWGLAPAHGYFCTPYNHTLTLHYRDKPRARGPRDTGLTIDANNAMGLGAMSSSWARRIDLGPITYGHVTNVSVGERAAPTG